MLNQISNLNWIAVLVASAALSMLGAFWFMALFGKQYAVALGRTDLKDQKPSPLFIIGPLLCGAVVVITNAGFMNVLGIKSYENALIFGAVVGFGYLVSTTFNVAINPNIPRPMLYGLISGGYFFVGSLLSGVILVALS
jgi:Protein of unknown function (DUF1761)